MLTFFTTAKPFEGHIGIIQRNAIRSWQKLHPDVEIILMGDDAGAAEVCAEMGLRHIPKVRRNKYGTKYLGDQPTPMLLLTDVPLIAGLAIYGLGAILMIIALKHGRLALTVRDNRIALVEPAAR